MSITVADAYKLPTLKNAKILTGQSGFQNLIDRMSILDYEYISYKMQGEFNKNDFVLSSLLFAKDDVNLMSAAVKTLIDNGVSLLGIKDVYYKELPEELLRYAVERNFSIFLFTHDAYFEDIITDVTDALRLVDRNQLIEMKVDNLIGNELSRSLVRELALDINSNFLEACGVVCCRPGGHMTESALYRTLERLKNLECFRGAHSVFKYKNSMMAVLTYPPDTSVSPSQLRLDFLTMTNLLPEEYRIGVSDCFSHLHHLDKAIQQSLFACDACNIENKTSAFYRDIGLHRLTIPLRGNYWFEEYSRSILDPIRQYDRKYSADLLHTAEVYINCDGSIKRTAEILFQHENTIRYRIGKVKELLGLEGENARFFPQLCIAILAYQLEHHL